MTLLKNVVLWDGSPPGSAGVPNLFGLSPPGCQFVDEKPPNKLGTPTGDAFFNRILDTRPSGALDRRSPDQSHVKLTHMGLTGGVGRADRIENENASVNEYTSLTLDGTVI